MGKTRKMKSEAPVLFATERDERRGGASKSPPHARACVGEGLVRSSLQADVAQW